MPERSIIKTPKLFYLYYIYLDTILSNIYRFMTLYNHCGLYLSSVLNEPMLPIQSS